MSDKKEDARPTRTFERDGYKSPVLRAKRDEVEADFRKRMVKYGWKDLDKASLHSGPEQGTYHAGPKDDCPYCVRQSKRIEKRKKTTSAKVETPNGAVKGELDASKAKSEPKPSVPAKEEVKPVVKADEAAKADKKPEKKGLLKKK